MKDILFCSVSWLLIINCINGTTQLVNANNVSSSTKCNLSNGIYNPKLNDFFGCECFYGYRGPTCSLVDYCLSSPCIHSASCTNHPTTYTCACLPGWEGPDCSIDTNECLGKPCQNKGTCHNKRGFYECRCLNGFSGQNCENEVQSNFRCWNGGRIKFNPNKNHNECECSYGFYGKYCDKKVDFCPEGVCGENGVCIVDGTDISCKCKQGFEGQFCEHDVDECGVYGHLCHNEGTCLNTVGNFSCLCPLGFEGRFCQFNVDECKQNECAAGSKCIDQINSYRCECPKGKTGIHCEFEDKCTGPRNPCQNEAICNTNFFDGSITCDCRDNSFHGKFCEKDTDECSGKKDLCNKGTCLNEYGSFRCECGHGYKGKYCDDIVEYCPFVMCENGGSCVNLIGSYNCICRDGFVGERCEIRAVVEQSKIDTFNKENEKIKAECEFLNCRNVSGNGNCDPECNFYSCGFDGGDCSAKIVEPYQFCNYKTYCAFAAKNGVCDQVCNNEHCLFDADDCLDTSLTKLCKKKRGNGICDKECNLAEYQFDGGDCSNSKTKKSVLEGNVVLTLDITPNLFLSKQETFFKFLSEKLRAKVDILKDEDGKLQIFKYDMEKGETELLKLNKSYSTSKKEGVMLALTVDVSLCLNSKNKNECFSDIYAVGAYLGASAARYEFEQIGVPMYAARIRTNPNQHPTTVEDNSFSWTSLVAGIICVCLLTIMLVGVVLDRKRKLIHAPIWKPLNQDGSISTYNSNILLQGNIDCKRAKLDEDYSMWNSQYAKINHAPAKKQLTTGNSAYTALHQACESAFPLTEDHFTYHMDVNVVEPKFGDTPLHKLIESKCDAKSEEVILDGVKLLLHKGASINAVNLHDQTALLIATRYQLPKVCELLIHCGADLNLSDDKEMTPLHHAAILGNIDIVHLICSTKQASVDLCDQDCHSIAMNAVLSGMEEAISILDILDKCGCELDNKGNALRDTFTGRTPLHVAAAHDEEKIIEFLVSKKANKDAQDKDEQTPLFVAAAEGNMCALNCLLNLGANKDLSDKMDRTAETIAFLHGHHAIVKRLQTFRLEPKKINLDCYGKPTTKTRKRPIKAVKTQATTRVLSPLTPPTSEGSNFSDTSSPHGHTYIQNSSGVMYQGSQYATIKKTPPYNMVEGKAGPSTSMINFTPPYDMPPYPHVNIQPTTDYYYPHQTPSYYPNNWYNNEYHFNQSVSTTQTGTTCPDYPHQYPAAGWNGEPPSASSSHHPPPHNNYFKT